MRLQPASETEYVHGRMRSIVLRDHAGSLSEGALNVVAHAVAIQLDRDVSPAWGKRVASGVGWVKPGAQLDAGAIEVAVFRDFDHAASLGYGADAPGGLPYEPVFVDDGGSLTVRVSAAAIESAVDADALLWMDRADGTSEALEVTAPFPREEGAGYEVEGTYVANFLLPGEFGRPRQDELARDNFLGHLMLPGGVEPGGYRVLRALSGSLALDPKKRAGLLTIAEAVALRGAEKWDDAARRRLARPGTRARRRGFNPFAGARP
jgi:hypothetical protein